MATRKGKKTTGKTTARARRPDKVEQPHGGALNAGGTPGNKGGPGRPADKVRAAFLRVLEGGGVATVRDIAQGRLTVRLNAVCQHCGKKSEGPSLADLEKMLPSVANRLDAIDMAARYAVGPLKALTVDTVAGRVDETYTILQRELDPATFARIDALLAEVWQ